MKAKRPSQPWKVVFFTAAAPLPERKFRSERATYLAVNTERELIRDGASRVKRAVVYQWDQAVGRWMTFDRHDLVEEAKSLPPKPVEEGDDLAEKILDEVLDENGVPVLDENGKKIRKGRK